MPRVIQRLDAQVIAGEKELAALAVPQREREHARDAVEHLRPPCFPTVDQHFAVARRNEDVSCGCELASQRAKVVNLAVEDDRNRAVGGHERLPAQGKVDHRQPAMTEADRTVEMESVGVRAAMRERGRHQRQRGARTRIVGVIAGNAAHGKGGTLEDDRLAPVAMKRKL